MSAQDEIHEAVVDPGDVVQIEIQETVHADFLGEIEVTFLRLLRHLPGRRSVWKARSELGELLLKVYHPHPKQERDVAQEWSHAIRLQDAALPAPEPLFLASDGEERIILAFVYLKGGETLDAMVKSAWLGFDRNEVYRQLLDLHASMYQAGVYQKDNHLGNYFWSGGKLWLLDPATCRFVEPPLTGSPLRENVALLLANIPLPDRNCVDSLMAESSLSAVDLRDGFHAIRKRMRSYYRKTRRSCSEFEHLEERQASWWLCRDLEPEVKDRILSGMGRLFSEGKLLKDGNTCTVVDVRVGEHSYIVKRYNRKPLMYRWLHRLASPRALKSWTNGHVLRLFGIATPRPLACGVLRSGGTVDMAYLVMEKVKGEPLWDLDKQSLLDPERGLAQQFGQLLWSLDALQATHGDMKGSNLVVDEQGVLTLIDLDGTRFYSSPSKHRKKRAKDIRRFLRNWEKMPEVHAMFRQVIDAAGQDQA